MSKEEELILVAEGRLTRTTGNGTALSIPLRPLGEIEFLRESD